MHNQMGDIKIQEIHREDIMNVIPGEDIEVEKKFLKTAIDHQETFHADKKLGNKGKAEILKSQRIQNIKSIK
jgi:hemerythrin superfamily protein